jgi:hypothetical protein
LAASAATPVRRFWWVNQNQTHRAEIPGGFMWSPKRSANGARNQFYENMTLVEPGDVVFSYYDTRIQHVGVAVTRAETAPKPDFGSAGENWSQEGWLVGVEYDKVAAPPRPKSAIDRIRPLLPSKYSPLLANGNGLQSVYLAEVSDDLADVLIELTGSTYPAAVTMAEPDASPDAVAQEDAAVANIQGRTDIGAVEREQLVKARRGQGIFRTNVRMNESRCRVTGVTDKAHLRASHIKPWKDCDDQEKLHGCNGLLLSHHIDHLFDRGWISFGDNGDLLIAEDMNSHVLTAWGISGSLNVGPFNETQSQFLEYHRTHVLRRVA